MKMLKTIAMFLLFVPALALAQTLANPTQAEMMSVLGNVWVLYALMMLGTLASQLKQANVARQSGSDVSNMDHVMRLREWVVLFITNSLSFAALIHMGQLSFVSAVSVGFVLNELTDLDPTSSRSNALMSAGAVMKLKE